MHRLHPAGLLGLGADAFFGNCVEQMLRAVADEADEAFSGDAMAGDDGIGIDAGQRRDHLPVVAAGCAPAGLRGFQHQRFDAGTTQVECCRQSREAGADDDGIDAARAYQRRVISGWFGHRRP